MSVAYRNLFFMDFVGMPDDMDNCTPYRVYFAKRDAGEAPLTEIIPAPSPFVISLQDEEDPLTPIRTTTARISFTDDIRLKELLPSDGFEWRVTLHRLTDNKEIFVGYLTAEVYTQPDIEGPNIVTINAISPLDPIGATAMDILNIGSLSIGELLYMAISESNDIRSIYLPALYTMEEASTIKDYAKILSWKFSTGNFIKKGDLGVVTGEIYECETYSVALEAICKLFGWSLADMGDGSWYFVSPGYMGQYIEVTKEQLNVGSITPTAQSPNISSETTLEPIDKENTVDFRQGVGTITLSVASSTSAVEMPNIEQQISKWNYSKTESQVWQNDDVVKKAAVGCRNATLNNGEIITPRYRPIVNRNSSGFVESVNWEIISDESTEEKDVMAQYVEFDSCDPAEITATDGKTAEKREWNFQGAWEIDEQRIFTDPDGAVKTVFVPDTYPYIKYTGRVGLLTAGAMRITFDIRAAWNRAFSLTSDYHFSGGNMENYVGNIAAKGSAAWVDPTWWGKKKYISVSLAVGNRYWDGSQWVGFFTKFQIPISVEDAEWHPILSNKTIDMPYAGLDGLYIPVDGSLGGYVEFCIYPKLADYEGEAEAPEGFLWTGIYKPAVYIRGLNVSYEPQLDYSHGDEKDSTYYRNLGLSFKDKKETTLLLHSKINNSEQMSLLYDSSNQVIDKVLRATSNEKAKPEQYLLDNYERLYGRVSQRLRRGITLQDIKPFDLFTKGSEEVWCITGTTIDFGENVAELRMSEVKSETPKKYV